MQIEKMRAAILVNLQRELVVDNVTLPSKLEIGQVLVKIFYSGICGSQLGEIKGVKGKDNYLPHLMGHEGSGKVLETGPGVTTVKTGDHVVLHWRKSDGIDASSPVYQWTGRHLNAGCVTTFNEFAVVSENRLTTIPKDFDLSLAPLFGCAVTVGLGIITNNAQLKIGDSIVVFGAGGVGLNVIQGASMTTAYPIIAIDLYDHKLEMAKRFGATHLINSSQVDPATEIRKILGVKGADVIIENTGDVNVIATAYNLTQPQGKTVLVGVPQFGHNASIYTLPLHFGKTLIGSHGGESLPSIDIPKYIRLYESGRLKLDELITDDFSLDGINLAIQKLNRGEISGRCLIKLNHS